MGINMSGNIAKCSLYSPRLGREGSYSLDQSEYPEIFIYDRMVGSTRRITETAPAIKVKAIIY